MIKIGIDPGKHTGYAEYHLNDFLRLDTIDFWTAILRIDGHKNVGNNIHVYVEQPALNRAVWTAKSKITEAIRKQKNFTQSVDIGLKIAKNIGQNIEHAELIIAFCKLIGVPVTGCKPNERSLTKTTKEEFLKFTGYTGHTSEHSRDAGMLVWGR